MKKILIILAIVVVVIFILLVTIPLLFKSQIVDIAKTQANKQLNATLNFDDVGLSLLKHFPKFTATVNGLSIVNKEPFEGDTLLYMKEFEVTINLGSIIFGKQIEVVSISLIEPRIFALVLEDGRANWDIVPVDTLKAAPDTAKSVVNMAVQKYGVTDADLKFVDQASGMEVDVSGLNHSGRGDFDQEIFTLVTRTLIDTLTVKMGDIAYLNKAELEINADIEMDMANNKYSFKENEIRLNQLFLNFDGWVAMPNDKDIDMDITFDAPKAEFKNILSMVPAIYMKDFSDLEAEGQLSLAGTIKGVYNEHSVPNFDINLGVSNGMFQYPDLPTPVKNVSVDMNINNPGRNLDDTVIDLKKFHLEILNEPVDFRLLVKTPVSDPYIDAKFTGVVNLADAKNVVPMEQEIELKGMVNADFRFQGNMSNIENQHPEKLEATGDISVSNVEYGSADVPVPVSIKSAQLKLTPYNASLSNLVMNLGESDLRASGGLDNMIGFVLSDQTLKGSLDVNSNYFDLTPWMVEEDTTALAAVEVPDKIEFLLTANFKKVRLNNLEMTNTTGQILIKDRKAKMIELKSNLMGGSMVSNGTYEFIPPAKPHMNFDLAVKDLSIPEMFKTVVTVQQVAPLAEYLQGNMTGNLQLNSDLGDSLMPDLSTFFSKGSVDIPRAKIEGFSGLNELAEELKIKELYNPTMVNFDPSYLIDNGRLTLNQTDFKLAGYDAQTSGSIGFDKSLVLSAVLNIPTTELGTLLNQDLSMLEGQTTKVPAEIGGTVKNPKVNIALDQVAANVAGQLKQAGVQAAEEKKAEMEQKAKEELDKKKEEAKDEIKDKIKGLFGK